MSDFCREEQIYGIMVDNNFQLKFKEIKSSRGQES